MKYYVDTNVFVRFLVADDNRMHASCAEMFGLIEERKIQAVTSATVFAEVVWVLGSVYKFPRQKISEALTAMGRGGIAFDNRSDIVFAAGLYGSYPVKFIDALIASHPLLRQGRMALVSYDADFDKLGIKRKEPKEIVANLKA